MLNINEHLNCLIFDQIRILLSIYKYKKYYKSTWTVSYLSRWEHFCPCDRPNAYDSQPPSRTLPWCNLEKRKGKDDWLTQPVKLYSAFELHRLLGTSRLWCSTNVSLTNVLRFCFKKSLLNPNPGLCESTKKFGSWTKTWYSRSGSKPTTIAWAQSSLPKWSLLR